MAKIRKFKLSWKPSESDLVIGYKLYWSINTPVNYSSKSIKLSKVNEVDLPDIVIGLALSGESIYLGISAVDIIGNESDIMTLYEPYNISVLPAPEDLALIGQDDFKILEEDIQDEDPIQGMENENTKQNGDSIEKDGSRSPIKLAGPEAGNVDDFGFSIKKIFEKNG